jgi:thioredoxin reductase
MAEFDLIVLGAGPAGATAAVVAAKAGMKVALFDENPAAGGQVYRAVQTGLPLSAAEAAHTPEQRAGDQLRAQLRASTVQTFLSHQVWAATGDYRIDASGPRGPVHCMARALIVAAGTTERVVPFDGWTTPGVIGLAAASLLLRSQQSLPGRSILIAGCGPLLAAVAAKTVAGGNTVAAIADLASVGEWARALPAMMGAPELLRRGIGWWRTLRRARVPIFVRHTIVKVEPIGERLRATLAPCDAAGRPSAGKHRTAVVDCVAVGHGLTPATEVTRLLRAAHRYSRAAGGWIAIADQDGRTSRPRLYVAGDAAGIAGAAAAATHGTSAALACVLELGAADRARLERELAAARARHQRTARLGRALAQLMALRAGHVEAITPATIVCRCEDTTCAEIDAAFRAGACDLNQLKAWTRCGMGPCQGRTCGDIAGDLLALRSSARSREYVGCFSARTPLRPVAIEALTGEFTYEVIPIPTAAPI